MTNIEAEEEFWRNERILNNQLSPITDKPVRVPFQLNVLEKEYLKKRRLTKVTQIEEHARKRADSLTKTIKYLYMSDVNESVRTKVIRDIIEDNLLSFHDQHNHKDTP